MYYILEHLFKTRMVFKYSCACVSIIQKHHLDKPTRFSMSTVNHNPNSHCFFSPHLLFWNPYCLNWKNTVVLYYLFESNNTTMPPIWLCFLFLFKFLHECVPHINWSLLHNLLSLSFKPLLHIQMESTEGEKVNGKHLEKVRAKYAPLPPSPYDFNHFVNKRTTTFGVLCGEGDVCLLGSHWLPFQVT